MKHIFVDYLIYNEIKNHKYGLDKGISNFKINELDEGVIFFDEDNKYIDPKRFEFENIKVNKVLIPRFIWEEFYDKLNNFRVLDIKNSKNIEFLDFFKEEISLKKQYKKVKLKQEFKMKFGPRENQKDSIKAIFNKLKDGTIRGILKGLPGIGKTFLSIYLASYFKKTLIVVPKTVLVDQWISEILSFTELKENEIQEIQGSNLKEIEEVLNNPNIKIVISKPQSILSQIKRINTLDLINLYSSIDLAVIDECHNFGALGYSKVCSILKTPNIFGVTATPKRKGLNDFLLKTSIGEVFYEAEAEVLTPKVTIQTIPQEKIPFAEKEIKILNMKRGDYIQFLTFFNMFLANKKEYFDYLAQWVYYQKAFDHKSVVLFNTIKMIKMMEKSLLQINPKLNVLALTGNSKKDALNIAKDKNKILREELKRLKEELDIKVKNKEIKRKEANEIYKEERLKSKELQELNIESSLLIYKQEIKNADIILGTYGLLREGFDKPELSHVIFGSPVIGLTSLIQVLGRITRLFDGKPMPLAQFFLHEIFLEQNKHAIKTIINNIKSEYPLAEIEFL